MRLSVPWGGPTPPIGVDFNGRRCTAAQWTAEAGGGLRTVRIRRPDPAITPTAEEFRRLAGVLERHGFVGGSLAVAAPCSSVMIETIDLPPASSGAPLDDLARGQLAMMYRIAPDAITASAIGLPPRRDNGPPRSLAVGCRAEELAPVLAAAESAGLRIDHVTVGGLAVASTDPAVLAAEAIASASGATGGGGGGGGGGGTHVRLLLLLGWRWSDLLVLRNGRLASARSLPELGLQPVAEKFERMGIGELEIEPEEEAEAAAGDAVAERSELVTAYAGRLVAELRRSIGYVEQEHGPVATGDMRVLGDGVAVPGLVDRLAEQVRMTVAAERFPAVAGVAACLAADARLPWRRNAA